MKTRAAAVLLVALMVAACGTRLPDKAFDNQTAVVAEGGTADGTGGAAGDVTGDEAGATTTTLAAGQEGAAGTGTDGAGGGAGPAGGGGGAGAAASGPNQASDAGVTPTSITIGNITAENGVLGDAFAPAVRGLRAWAQNINATGGINGRKVILKTCDDREDRARALECARRLVEQDKVFALVATNTRAMGGAAQYLEDKGIPVLGIPITNSFYRYTHFWTFYGAGYARDGKTVGYKGQIMNYSSVYRWFKQNMGVTKAAVVSYDIDESKQAGGFMAKGLELEGFRTVSYSVSFAAPSFDQAVADMKRQGIEIIFDAMDDGANRKLCDAMARGKLTVKAKVSTIVGYSEKAGSKYNDTCRNVLFIGGTSVPFTSQNVPAVAEFRKAYAKYQPGREIHEWALEAFAMGTLTAEAIKAMGPAPTRKGYEDYLRGLKQYTANGVAADFDYQPIDYSKSTGRDCISVARWLDDKGGWVLAADKFPFCYDDAKLYGTEALEQGD